MVKQEKAITLIALIITIIILVILSAITINNIMKSNLFELAQKASENYLQASIQEGQAIYEFLNTIEKGLTSESETKVVDKTPGDLTDGGRLDGSEGKPYEISSIEDLLAFGQSDDEYKGQKIILTTDLDFKSKDSYANSEDTELFTDYNKDSTKETIIQEVAKGGYYPIENFNGIFDGNGHAISNLEIKAPANFDHYIGLISDIGADGCVRNLTVEGKINFLINEIELHYYRIGGVAGRILDGASIENCISKVNISVNIDNLILAEELSQREMYVGGIVGNNEGLVNNCKNYGNVSLNATISRKNDTTKSFNARLGGIAGENQNKIINSINSGSIESTTSNINKEILESKILIGGITGYCTEVSETKNCINLGKINVSSEDKTLVGGITSVIYCDVSLTPLENLFNAGNITATMNNSGKYLGIAGIIADGDCNLDYCFNIGNIRHNTIEGESVTKYYGAIVGDSHSDTAYTNCKYLEGSATCGVQSVEKDQLGNAIQIVKNLTLQQVLAEMNEVVKTHNASAPNEWISW